MEKETMRAVVIDKYGPAEFLTIKELPIPKPGPGEVLVKIIAAGVNPIDTYVRQGQLKWLIRSKFPLKAGKDFAGIVEEIGLDFASSNIEIGQRVFGVVKGVEGGSYAEYAIAKISEIASMPESISFEEAAALPIAVLTALQSLRNLAKLSPHQAVLINGGAGGVGLFAIQLAKLMNARVVAVSGSNSTELCKQYGADQVIDYNQTDIMTLTEKFDLFFDVVGNKSFSSIRELLSANGKYITIKPNAFTFIDIARTIISAQKAYALMCQLNTADLAYVADLVVQKKIRVLVSHTYTMEEAEQAHKQIESKHTQGKVVLRVSEAPKKEEYRSSDREPVAVN